MNRALDYGPRECLQNPYAEASSVNPLDIVHFNALDQLYITLIKRLDLVLVLPLRFGSNDAFID